MLGGLQDYKDKEVTSGMKFLADWNSNGVRQSQRREHPKGEFAEEGDPYTKLLHGSIYQTIACFPNQNGDIKVVL